MFKNFCLKQLRWEILFLREELDAERKKVLDDLQNLRERRSRARDSLIEEQKITILLCRELAILNQLWRKLESEKRDR